MAKKALYSITRLNGKPVQMEIINVGDLETLKRQFVTEVGKTSLYLKTRGDLELESMEVDACFWHDCDCVFTYNDSLTDNKYELMIVVGRPRFVI